VQEQGGIEDVIFFNTKHAAFHYQILSYLYTGLQFWPAEYIQICKHFSNVLTANPKCVEYFKRRFCKGPLLETWLSVPFEETYYCSHAFDDYKI